MLPRQRESLSVLLVNAFDRFFMNVGPFQGTVIAILVVGVGLAAILGISRFTSISGLGWCLAGMMRIAGLAVAGLALWLVVRSLRAGEIRLFTDDGAMVTTDRVQSPVRFWVELGVFAGLGFFGLRTALFPQPRRSLPEQTADHAGADPQP